MRAFKHRFTILLAGILFLISFALPAFDGMNGLKCAKLSVDALMNVLLNPEQFSSLKELLFSLYIGMFNITNIFTVFLIIKNSMHPDRRLPFFVRGYYVIVIFCTASLWIIALASGDLKSLGPGYYLWLLSVTLLGIYNWLPANSEPAPKAA